MAGRYTLKDEQDPYPAPEIKELEPWRVGWLLINKEERIWEKPDGALYRFPPHIPQLVLVLNSWQAPNG